MTIASLEPGGGHPFAERFYDLLIVGSGPVGLAIASECAAASIRTLVLEGGGIYQPNSADEADGFENAGMTYRSCDPLVRSRAFGGTSNVWSGRCTIFDPIDFERRDWVRYSGWPFGEDELIAYLDRSRAYLGLVDQPYDESFWDAFGSRPFAGFCEKKLRSQFWQYSRDASGGRDFVRAGRQFLRTAPPNVDILLGANVTRINFSREARAFQSLEVAAPDGSRTIVRGRRAVLCAGGIETPRLLLLSLRGGSEAPSASLAMTGRFLMDHPKCVLGVFDPDDDHDIRQVLGLYNLRRRGGQAFTHGVALSPALQRQERLLNCAAWLTEQRSPDDPWEALKRVAVGTGGQARDIAAVARNLPFALKGATHYLTRGRGVLHKCESILLEASVEQEPNPESRVTLSSSLDAFGEPLARIDWKIGELELKTLIAFGEVIVAEFRRLGLPAPRLADWIRDRDPAAAPMRDAAHPIGATRMSVDPADGVVDPDCKVHGIDGLYVGGSSVFPTAGHANPTLMAVALAVRLADKLKASKP